MWPPPSEHALPIWMRRPESLGMPLCLEDSRLATWRDCGSPLPLATHRACGRSVTAEVLHWEPQPQPRSVPCRLLNALTLVWAGK